MICYNISTLFNRVQYQRGGDSIGVIIHDPLHELALAEELESNGFSVSNDIKLLKKIKFGPEDWHHMLVNIETDVSNPIEQDSHPPEKGNLLYQTPGKSVEIYKRRFGLKRLGIGKSGGFRLIYVLAHNPAETQSDYIIIPIHLYAKNQGQHPKPDLTGDELSRVKELANNIENDLYFNL